MIQEVSEPHGPCAVMNASLWKGEVELLRHLETLGPLTTTERLASRIKAIVGGVTENLTYSMYLIEVTGTRKQRSQVDKLGHDGAESPHVDRIRVISAEHEDLWGSIPTSGDVFGVRWSAEGFSSEAKVG